MRTIGNSAQIDANIWQCESYESGLCAKFAYAYPRHKIYEWIDRSANPMVRLGHKNGGVQARKWEGKSCFSNEIATHLPDNV